MKPNKFLIMKKLAVLLGAMAITGASFAQSMDTPMSLEGVLGYNGSSLNWSAPTIRFRYFVNENIAGRVQLGLGDGTGTPASESYTYYENADATGNSGTVDISRSGWNAQIGGEYHMSATDRLSPYFALGIDFGGGSYSETWTNSDGGSYVDGLSAQVDAGYSMFGVSAGAGVDFYIVENLGNDSAQQSLNTGVFQMRQGINCSLFIRLFQLNHACFGIAFEDNPANILCRYFFITGPPAVNNLLVIRLSCFMPESQSQ